MAKTKGKKRGKQQSNRMMQGGSMSEREGKELESRKQKDELQKVVGERKMCSLIKQ